MVWMRDTEQVAVQRLKDVFALIVRVAACIVVRIIAQEGPYALLAVEAILALEVLPRARLTDIKTRSNVT